MQQIVRLFGADIVVPNHQQPNPPTPDSHVAQDVSSPKRRRMTAHQSPPLPKVYRDLLVSIGAKLNDHNPVHIFTKRLYKSDIQSAKNRLTFSPKSLLVAGFLDREEEEWIQRKDDNRKPLKIEVQVIDPTCNVWNLSLTKWNWQNNDVGDHGEKKGCWSYALINGWREVVAASRLGIGDVVQIWSFRGVDGGLGFVIHKVGESRNEDGGDDDEHSHEDGGVLNGSSSSDRGNHGGASSSGGSA